MNNQLNQLLYLAQLEEYDIDRIKKWLNNNTLSSLNQDKKPLVYTFKIRLLEIVLKLFFLFKLPVNSSLLFILQLLKIPDSTIKNTIVFICKLLLKLHANLIVIGIAGSYGKTSVKEILAELLNESFTVLKTPLSHNTPLGIAKVILSQLKNQQIFICEIGAYQIGEIKKICGFVKPKIGILTSIGKQHMERFGSQENIIRAKSEILTSLPPDGLAVTNADNQYCFDIAGKINVVTNLFSISKETLIKTTIPILLASDIAVDASGSKFTIIDNDKIVFQTKLLGTHNIQNILAALIVAKHLGITWPVLQQRVANLKPIPHRLEIIPGVNQTTVIDDSYNANPDSVREALNVMNLFSSPVKIVITPGLVELGEIQDKENEIYGENIAKSANYLIIVGHTNEDSLKKGFLKIKPTEKLILAENLKDATDKLTTIIVPGAVFLFSNDLPDQYQ